MDSKIQGAIILIVILIIGIIIRWNFIMESILRGFKFFST